MLMVYTPIANLSYALKGPHDRRTFLIGVAEGMGLTALVKPTTLYAQSSPSPIAQPLPSHMDHVKAMEGKPDKERANYIVDFLKSRNLEHRIDEYKAGWGRKGLNILFEAGVGEKAVIFTAHYDVFPGSPGANDDASCVAVMLNAYEQLAKQNLPNVRARFVVFGDEENHRVGSKAYVKANQDRLSKIVGVYSLELCGAGDTLYAWDVISDDLKNSQIMKVLGNVAKNQGVELRVRGEVRMGGNEANYSDHVSFRDKGVPGFGLTILPGDNPRAPFADYHQPSDTADKLQSEAMERMNAIVIRIAKEFNNQQ